MGCVGSPTDVHRGKRRTVAPPGRRLTVARGVALPLSVPLPSLGRQQSGRHWRCAVHGGRGPPYHSGSCSPSFSGYDLCGVPVRRRGPARSSRPPCGPAAGAGGRVTLRLPSRVGGGHPPCLGGGVAPRPPRSRSGRRPAVPLSGSLRVAGALPSGARVRWGLKCRPGVGGVRGGPWTAPLGVPADLQTPPLSPRSGLWLREGHAGRRLLRVPLRALLRHAGVGSREQVQPPLPLPCRRSSCGWGRPPGPGGAEGRACGSPAGVGAGGGGGATPPALGPVWEGGGSGGGPSVPWRCLLSAKRGGGRLGGPGPGGQPSARGVAPFPRPPLPRAGSSRSPSLGPLIPRPLPRGAGRPGVAVRVSGQWLAGCGAAGFPPRLLSPHSPPREVACRFPWVGNKAGVTWCRAVHGGRGHPYHSGSRPPGFSGHDLRGVPVRRRGPTCSSRPPFEPAAGAWGRVTLRPPSRAGGVHPFCLGGWGPGPPWLTGRWGGGGGGGVCRAAASPLSFQAAACGTPSWLSPCRRCAPFRRARAVGAEVPPRGGGGEGRPVDRPPGGPI